ncbi:MAG: BfmA/BtgA family mobilization protein [Polaribacter sp.]|nr:BfmA/BtgA family mobilization protein [Polaribacter sp.]
MDDFNTIRLKKKVIEKFKEYSKKTSPSYSETLDYMVAFFEDTGLSPYDTMHNPILSFTRTLSKRTKAVMTILRNIEKTQLIPTREMLESLFKEVEEEPIYIERTSEEIEASKTEADKLIDSYSKELDKNKKELYEVRNEFSNLLNELSYIKNTFGKSYYRLEISKEKIEELKSNFL